MSLDKSIEHGKDHRKPYHGAKAVDPSCRNHGSCTYCERGRLHKSQKVLDSWKQRLLDSDND